MELSRNLSPNGKARIKALSGPRPRPFITALATTWLVIALAVAAAIYGDSWWVSLAAILVVASRQNLLALLLHEQTHYLGIKGKHGDTLVDLLVAYPLLVVSVGGYSDIHLRHHRHYFTPQDPDFLRKNGPEWTFPMPLSKLAGLFLQDITGISFVKYCLRKKPGGVKGPPLKRRNPSPRWLRPAFLVFLAVSLTVLGGWKLFLLLWVLPLMFIFPALVRWGAICEHIYGHENATVDDSSPLIFPTSWQRLILPNLNFSMHPYHHYFPAVSFSNLPAVHEIFAEENLVNTDLVFHGCGDYLRYLLGFKRRAAPSPSQPSTHPDRAARAPTVPA